MAVLSDQNLQEYKKCLDELNVQTKAWTTYLSAASSAINKRYWK